MNRKKHAITVLSILMIGLIATLAGCTNERRHSGRSARNGEQRFRDCGPGDGGA